MHCILSLLPGEEKMSKSYQSLEEIEWTHKNIVMLSLALVVLFAGIGYGMWESNNIIEQKREKLQKMSLDELGVYIIEHNEGTVHIDLITQVKDIYLSGNRLVFPYYVSEGFLRKLATKASGGLERNKLYLQKNTLKEDCSKTAFRIFLQKGGVMHYEYRLVKDGEEKFLFDFNNTYEMCPEKSDSI